MKRIEFRNLLNAQNRDELRQWLSENYNKEPECWVVVKQYNKENGQRSYSTKISSSKKGKFMV